MSSELSDKEKLEKMEKELVDWKVKVNSYTKWKSAAEGLLDLTLLTATVFQMVSVIDKHSSHKFFIPVMILVVISLCLQLTTLVLLIWLFFQDFDVKDPEVDEEDIERGETDSCLCWYHKYVRKVSPAGHSAADAEVDAGTPPTSTDNGLHCKAFLTPCSKFTKHQRLVFVNKLTGGFIFSLLIIHAILAGLGFATVTSE